MARCAAVTVIVATRDRPQSLQRCVRALATQDMPPMEVVVVDQGTQPVDPEPVIPIERTSIVLLRDEGVGVSRARNVGLAAARCPVVAVVDDDCLVDSRWLASIVAVLEADSGIDAVCGPVLPLPADGDRIFALSSRTNMTSATYTDGAIPWRVGTGGNFAARGDVLRHLGGYDCRLGPGSAARACEDIDLIYRMLRSGARIRYCPDAVVRHERVAAIRRRASRRSYGRGMGAFIGVHARRREVHAGVLLGAWVIDRLKRLARAAARFDAIGTVEEAIVLASTAGGLAYGVTLPPEDRS